MIAECAGLLYLARTLDGMPMCGVVDADTHMTDRLTLGYRTAAAATDSVLAEAGSRVRGHEFHRTAVKPEFGRLPAWQFAGDRAAGWAGRGLRGRQRRGLLPPPALGRRALVRPAVRCRVPGEGIGAGRQGRCRASPGERALAAGHQRSGIMSRIGAKRLIGVGVGPGDPELVTIKAVRVLAEAGLVLVPVMADAGPAEPGRAEATVRAHIDGARIRRVPFALNDRGGVTPGRKAAWEAAAHEVATAFAHGTAAVAFATIGDPNIYSTFSYLAQTVRQLVPDVTVDTVPGITAMQDLASRSGTVLTEGNESLVLLPLIRGPRVSGACGRGADAATVAGTGAGTGAGAVPALPPRRTCRSAPCGTLFAATTPSSLTSSALRRRAAGHSRTSRA